MANGFPACFDDFNCNVWTARIWHQSEVKTDGRESKMRVGSLYWPEIQKNHNTFWLHQYLRMTQNIVLIITFMVSHTIALQLPSPLIKLPTPHAVDNSYFSQSFLSISHPPSQRDHSGHSASSVGTFLQKSQISSSQSETSKSKSQTSSFVQTDDDDEDPQSAMNRLLIIRRFLRRAADPSELKRIHRRLPKTLEEMERTELIGLMEQLYRLPGQKIVTDAVRKLDENQVGI